MVRQVTVGLGIVTLLIVKAPAVGERDRRAHTGILRRWHRAHSSPSSIPPVRNGLCLESETP